VREEIELFLNRAEIFRRDAEFDFKNGDYDISMFHLEQGFQLLIKAKLLEVKGSYPRFHSLRRLLLELAESWNRESDEVYRGIHDCLKGLGESLHLRMLFL
jgi:HEPN domain-containing protein